MRYLSHSLSTERGEETSSNARMTLEQKWNPEQRSQNSGLAKLTQFLSQAYHHSTNIDTIKVQLNELQNILRYKQQSQGFDFYLMSVENKCKPLQLEVI